MYDYIRDKNKKTFNDIENSGLLVTKYLHIFSMMQKERMFCDHPFLLTCHSDFKDLSVLEKSVRTFVEKRHAAVSKSDQQRYEVIIDEAEGNEERIEIAPAERPSEKFIKEVLEEIRN
jgi:hypothetical protein